MKKSIVAKLNVAVVVTSLTITGLSAGVSVDLPYPGGKLSNAKKIMQQVYYVNHFFAFKNYAIIKKGRAITKIIKKSKGKKALTETVERYLNNDYSSDPKIKSRDLAIFRSSASFLFFSSEEFFVVNFLERAFLSLSSFFF